MGGLNQRRVCLLLTQITNVKLRREGREGKREDGTGDNAANRAVPYNAISRMMI